MIVVGANVVLGALRSRNGASHVVLRRLLTGEQSFALSPAMVLDFRNPVLSAFGVQAMTPKAFLTG